MDVSLAKVSRVFGRSFALHRVDVTFRSRELTVVLGHNGAGKTTLLNILATVDRPTQGTVRFDGTPIDKFAKHHRRKIGWVSHDGLIYQDLTGRENLHFFATMYGLAAEDLVDDWLKRVGLQHAADQRVRAYSRGMKQRLSIARALMHGPELILLDEPLTGLDPNAKKEMLGLFREVNDAGATTIMITHDVSLERQSYDRVLVLRRGKLAYDGDAALATAFTEHAS